MSIANLLLAAVGLPNSSSPPSSFSMHGCLRNAVVEGFCVPASRVRKASHFGELT